MSQQDYPSPKKYNIISLDLRKTLVRLVLDEERSISKSACKLGIKLSTAKLIIKKYKQQGTFFQRKSERLNRQKIESKLEVENENIQEENIHFTNSLNELPIPSPTYGINSIQYYEYTPNFEQQMYGYIYNPYQTYWG